MRFIYPVDRHDIARGQVISVILSTRQWPIQAAGLEVSKQWTDKLKDNISLDANMDAVQRTFRRAKQLGVPN
ncbi:MAG: hypothetical protein CVU38_02205 [Chloroflexi bacterium HGW-Chloroflexi-1]|nr:MAG: hypothetical protein CVU38_02205 [Chloroflexi bacterium HGW-Chloroflexi-1]